LFLFKPLALLPVDTGNFILLAITVISFRVVAYLANVNKWLILISFPSWWILWQTQIDGLVMLGVAIGWWAIRRQKPIWQGLATLLLCLKPQVGGILAIVYLIQQRHWKAFIISTLVSLASFLIFGFWLITWTERILFEGSAAQAGNNFAQTITNIGLFPVGILFWVPLVLFRHWYTQEEYIPAIIAATMLSSPYAASYSLITTMAVPLPGWLYPILSLPFIGRTGYDLIIIAPIAIVIYPILKKIYLRMISPNRVNVVDH
jgi:hypothetical protein